MDYDTTILRNDIPKKLLVDLKNLGADLLEIKDDEITSSSVREILLSYAKSLQTTK